MGLKRYELELWDSFAFIKAKGTHKVLIFGSKSSKFRDYDKDNINKKVKAIINIHVCNELDM